MIDKPKDGFERLVEGLSLIHIYIPIVDVRM